MRLAAVEVGSAAVLAAIHAECFERAWTALDFDALLRDPATVALAAETGAGVDAFILLRRAADEAEIITLCVRPAARRRGLGRALVDAAATLLAGVGVRTLWLEVAVDNRAAIALYQAVGFERSGLRPRYYDRGEGVPVDALIMRRALNMPAP